MAGVMLKRSGQNVRILEQSTSSIREHTAAGMSTGPNGKAFLEKYDRVKSPYSFPCFGPQFVDKAGNVTKNLKIPLNLTNWDTLYYRLRANFDGLESEYCPNPPAQLESDGKATFDAGKQVRSISYNGNVVTMGFNNLSNGGNGTCHANLVIVADGANSTLRSILAPASKP